MHAADVDDELDYAIDYRDEESPTSSRVFVTRMVSRTAKQKQSRESRFSRRSGSRPSLSGMHRRGNRSTR